MVQIWSLSRGLYKAYTDEINIAKRIMRWSSVENCSIYYNPSMQVFAYDFIFPTRSYNRIARVLGLPERRKSPGRIKQGHVIQKSYRIAQVKSSKLNSVEVQI